MNATAKRPNLGQTSELILTTDAAHGVTTIDLYRGYQIVDKDEYVVICLNGAAVQCAHTPDQARINIDQLIEADARGHGTLISTYRGYDLREGANRVGVAAYIGGAFAFEEKNVTLARSQIDFILASNSVQPAPASAPTTNTPSAAERFARNAKLMGRRENNPNDLI